MRQERSLLLSPLDREAHERTIAAARLQLGEVGFNVAYADGEQMTPAQALEPRTDTPTIVPPTMTVATPDAPTTLITPGMPSITPTTIDDQQMTNVLAPQESLALPVSTELTGREIEVLRVLATGLTNVQIAQKLGISTLTVNAHVRSIYNKLEINSRSAATRYAIEHKLL